MDNKEAVFARTIMEVEKRLKESEDMTRKTDDENVIELGADSDDEYGTDDEVDELAKTNASYGNFNIIDKEGKLIGLCDIKRFKWYLRKDLANKVDDKTIRINFEPKFKKGAVMNLVKRETKCVVCGGDDRLTKFHVIPLQFKRYFPKKKKEHNSSDVILLCKPCATRANHVTDLFKKDIFAAVGVSQRDFIDSDKVDIRKHSIKIIKNRKFNKSSDYEIKELRRLLKLNKDDPDPSYEELDKFTDINSSKCHEGFKTIGEFVTSFFNKRGKIDKFAEKWKTNFVTNLEPQYLPKDFYLNYNNSFVNPDGSIDKSVKTLSPEEAPKLYPAVSK